MKHGSIRRSISLPSDYVNSYSPDGLSETDIDALLVESGLDVDPVELDEIEEHDAAPVVALRGDAETPTTAPSGGEAA